MSGPRWRSPNLLYKPSVLMFRQVDDLHAAGESATFVKRKHMDSVTHLQLNIPDTTKPRVVVIGGGFGGANAIKYLNDQLFQIILFDKSNYNSFWPLLYQVATAGLQPDAIATPLRREFSNKKDFHFRALEIQ